MTIKDQVVIPIEEYLALPGIPSRLSTAQMIARIQGDAADEALVDASVVEQAIRDNPQKYLAEWAKWEGMEGEDPQLINLDDVVCSAGLHGLRLVVVMVIDFPNDTVRRFRWTEEEALPGHYQTSWEWLDE